MAEPQLKKVACPSCGAPLPFEPGEITTRCRFCHAVVERPLRDDQPARLKFEPAPEPRMRPAPASSPSVVSPLFPGLMVLLGIFLAIGLILLAVFVIVSQTTSRLTLILNGPVAPLPVDRPEGPDFIALAYDITGETYFYTRVNPIRGNLTWRGKKFKESSDVQTLVAGGDKFFAAEGAQLHAYRAADGVELWQAALSDKIGYCPECLSAEGNRAIALTQDYVIQAFDAGSGASAWTRRMDGYTAGFTLADGGLWVIDKVDGRFSLLFLNLEDGSVIRRITPLCEEPGGSGSSDLNASSIFLLDPAPSVPSADRSIYILYGWYPGCVDRWDASSATRIWQAEDDEGFSPSGDFGALFTPDALYFAYEDTLWSLAKPDGKIQILSEGGDYELVPLALEQGTLILRTKRTRGTEQYGLRGVDPRAGRTIWEYAFPDSNPLDPPDAAFKHVDSDESIWTWRIVGGRLLTMNFQADPNRVEFDSLDPRDGSSTGKQTLALDVSYDSYFGPEVLLWKEPVLWFAADAGLWAIDVEALTVKYKFP